MEPMQESALKNVAKKKTLLHFNNCKDWAGTKRHAAESMKSSEIISLRKRSKKCLRQSN